MHQMKIKNDVLYSTRIQVHETTYTLAPNETQQAVAFKINGYFYATQYAFTIFHEFHMFSQYKGTRHELFESFRRI